MINNFTERKTLYACSGKKQADSYQRILEKAQILEAPGSSGGGSVGGAKTELVESLYKKLDSSIPSVPSPMAPGRWEKLNKRVSEPSEQS